VGNRGWFVLLAAIAAAVAMVALGTVSRNSRAASNGSWAETVDDVCQHMQDRYTLLGRNYWKPLYVYPPRSLARVAVVRRRFLVIHADALTEIRAHVVARTRAQTRALRLYAHMLTTIRGVIRAAQGGDLRTYDTADVLMVRSIQATRDAFAATGTSNICNWGI
jgi:hypothetical protein